MWDVVEMILEGSESSFAENIPERFLIILKSSTTLPFHIVAKYLAMGAQGTGNFLKW